MCELRARPLAAAHAACRPSGGFQLFRSFPLQPIPLAMSLVCADELSASLLRVLSCLRGLGSPASPQQCNGAQLLARQVADCVQAAGGRIWGDLTTLRRCV